MKNNKIPNNSLQMKYFGAQFNNKRNTGAWARKQRATNAPLVLPVSNPGMLRVQTFNNLSKDSDDAVKEKRLNKHHIVR